RKHEIEGIDFVCVNLYPFERAALDPDAPIDVLLEEIDIGGVALLRAAAKSWRDVVVVASPDQYPAVLEAIEAGCVFPDELRARLAVEAFERTAAYDRVIASTLAKRLGGRAPAGVMPSSLEMRGELKAELRYGENPHQK